jgi:3-hydroxyacyl-CoA dehydrogenase/enoyl-CoA hydratase/3-hydroxybutyryl-CoA epimerase
VDVVIEAVAEDMEIKKTVLRAIEKSVSSQTIICSNTSSLSLDEMAGVLKHPERFVGLHFFNPVPRMPLVEVVAGPLTSNDTVVAAAELVKKMGKTPMIVSGCAGFLVNRILLPYLIESAWMFEEGIQPQRIDRLLEAFGMPMGPLELVDEVGLDVGYKVAKVLEDAYGPRMHVPEALGAVAETGGFLGKKSGAGFYKYRKGRKRPNRRVERLARDARREDGITARDLTDEQIVDRAILIMVNEAARCLEEGVIDEPEALDIAMVMGTGFAPFRGGLLRYADERGVVSIRDRLGELAAEFGERFKAAPLIEKIAGNGGRFYSDSAA